MYYSITNGLSSRTFSQYKEIDSNLHFASKHAKSYAYSLKKKKFAENTENKLKS